MPTIKQRIISHALAILEEHPEGVRWAELVRGVREADGSLNKNTISGTCYDLHEQLPEKVYKPSRGLFRLVKFRDPDTDQLRDELLPKRPKRVKEEDFYPSFADWLEGEVEECTKAIALGKNTFRDKWGTPDVIGIRKSKRSDIIEAPIEIVSAGIKLESGQLVTAFGQACAYCLFSHKTYLVVPAQSTQDEIARLDSLCQVFGLGLVLFDSSNPSDPQFSIRARPRYQQPDLFYANKYMKHIEKELFS